MKIILGPFFSRATTPVTILTTIQPRIAPLQIALEWSSPNEAHHIPLFRLEAPTGTKLKDILLRAADLPRDVNCTETHIVETSEEMFVPLDALLASLYRANESGRPIREILRELAAMVPLGSPVGRTTPSPGLLVPMAEQEGFQITKGVRQGDEILLSIGWRPRESASLFHVETCRFLMRQGKPAVAEWVQPQGEAGISGPLADDLHRLFPGKPSGLLTGAGHDYVASLPSRA
jgi:hypothetical protein